MPGFRHAAEKLTESFLKVASPLSLYLLLRIFVRDGLGIKLGFAIGTDFDFVPQICIAIIVLMGCLSKEEKIQFAFQKKAFTLCLASLVSFLFLTLNFKSSVSYAHPVFMGFWFALALLTVASSFFVFLPVKYFLNPLRMRATVASFFIGTSGLFAYTLLAPFWEPVARCTGRITFALLHSILPDLDYKIVYHHTRFGIDELTRLTHPLFGLAIGRGCGGLEGISLFVFIWALFVLIDSKRFSKFHWLLFLVLGSVYMYLLNVLRLMTYFLGVLSLSKLGANVSVISAASELFHAYLGWVLYCLGLGFIFYYLLGDRATILKPQRLKRLFLLFDWYYNRLTFKFK